MAQPAARPIAEHSTNLAQRALGSIGPAIVVAAVVLGPGSIMTSSQVGCGFGYRFLWLVALASLLMMGTTLASLCIGAASDASPATLLARHLGRGWAAALGIILFSMVALFQSSNNTALLLAAEIFHAEEASDSSSTAWKAGLLITVNLLVAGFLIVGAKHYRWVERSMGLLVALMVLGFATTFLVTRPDLWSLLDGFRPQWPLEGPAKFWPYLKDSVVKDDLLAVQALVATTFSIAGAYYQAYLVRQRGWTSDQISLRSIDSVVGIGALGLMTMLVMSTAAGGLHGRVEASQLTSLRDVAQQLRPVFGDWGSLVFALGILAGALSSFLVNALIGGTLLADGFGWGDKLQSPAVLWSTLGAMAIGLSVALLTAVGGYNPATAIVVAQSLTVVGGPAVAASLLYLLYRLSRSPSLAASPLTGAEPGSAPRALLRLAKLAAALALLLTLSLAARTCLRLILQGWAG